MSNLWMIWRILLTPIVISVVIFYYLRAVLRNEDMNLSFSTPEEPMDCGD
jgi:hypothetical protein